jgi:prevent-host-death family protein
MLVTMKKSRQMTAAEFKAKCLAVLDDVAAGQREVIVTKRGRPVARVVPMDGRAAPLDGLIVSQGDVLSPIDADRDAST